MQQLGLENYFYSYPYNFFGDTLHHGFIGTFKQNGFAATWWFSLKPTNSWSKNGR